MFTLTHTYNGVAVLLSLLTLGGLNTEQAFPGISILASQDDDILDLIGLVGTGRFVDDSETEYSFPLQGSDFVTGKTGILYVTITEALDAGWHTGGLGGIAMLPGVSGYAGCGLIQPGNVISYPVSLGISCRIYVLPDFWTLSETVTVGTPYTVPTIIR